MTLNIQEFFDKYNGIGIDYDHYYGYQCLDLAHQYAVEVVGQDIPSAPAAKDVWNKNCKGYDKIKNTPDNIPQMGDIIIWGTEIGQYGHIAIFHHGDINSFTSFDQNFPIGSLCHYQNHNYKGVTGWLHPKNSVIITQPTTKLTFQTIVPKELLEEDQDLQIQQIKGLLKDGKRDNLDLQNCRKAYDNLFLDKKRGIIISNESLLN